MRTDDGDQWVDDALAEIAPVTDEALAQLDLTEGFDDTLDHVLWSDVRGHARPLHRRRVSRRAAALALATVIVGSAGAAAAVKGGALTGLFGSPGSTEMDTSEYVNIAAPGFPALAHQLANQLVSDGLRFAPGFRVNEMTGIVIRDSERLVRQEERGNSAAARSTRENGILRDVTGVKGQFAALAQCTWQQSWLRAYRADSAVETKADIRGMTALNHVITSTPSKNGTFSGSIMAETNQKKALVGYVRHMQRGDYAFINRVVTINCPTVGT